MLMVGITGSKTEFGVHPCRDVKAIAGQALLSSGQFHGRGCLCGYLHILKLNSTFIPFIFKDTLHSFNTFISLKR